MRSKLSIAMLLSAASACLAPHTAKATLNPDVNPCVNNAAACIVININQDRVVTPAAPPPSDVDEARRTIRMSEQHKFVDPLIKPKSGGLIQFETPIKNKKVKTCS